METMLQDLRFAARTLARQPAFTAIAVFTLAVGIGANTAIYSLVDATLLRVLPFRDPAGLMKISLTLPPNMESAIRSSPTTWCGPIPSTRPSASSSRFFKIRRCTADYREPHRHRPARAIARRGGRRGLFPGARDRRRSGPDVFPAEDSVAGRDFVAVISHGLWQRRYGSDPKIEGKTIGLDLRNYTIVGVLPAGFQGLTGPADIWVPVHILPAEDLSQRWSQYSWTMVARRKPGVSVQQAANAVALLGPRIDDAHPDSVFRGWGAKARSARGNAARRLHAQIGVGAIRGGELRAPDRVREHRQPAAGARQCAPAGRSPFDWQWAPTAGVWSGSF